MTGEEALPVEEAAKVLANLEKKAQEAQSAVGAIRTFIAVSDSP